MELFTFFSQLDLRTISFMVSVAVFLQAGMISFQLFFYQQYRGIRTALVGNLCSAAGFLLFSQREHFGPFLTIILANTLVVTGLSLIYAANRLFVKAHSQPVAVLLPPGLALPFLLFFTYQHDSLIARTAAISLISAVPIGLTAKTLWFQTPEAYRKAARLTAIPYAFYTGLLFLRGVGVFLVPPQAVFEQSPVQIASFLGIFVLGNLWTIGFILMINERLQSDLRAMAATDYLTQLLNRRAMMDLLEMEVARSRRNKKPFAVLLVDLDRFKSVNDTHGHQAGDYVLVEVSKVLQNFVRAQDQIARWGGEEFLILLPETDQEQALVVGERLRSAIETSRFAVGPGGVEAQVSISVGVAGMEHSDTTALEKILALADEGLYLAKKTRNVVKSALI